MRAVAGKSTAAKAGIYLLSVLAVMACFYFMHVTHLFRVSAAQPSAAALALPASVVAAAPADFSAVPAHPEALAEPQPDRAPRPLERYSGPIELPANVGLPNLVPGLMAADVSPVAAGALQAEVERIAALGVEFPQQFEAKYLGVYHNTAYCCEVYPHICGGNGVTASGTVPTPGLTAAADWNLLPPGTWLYIRDVGIRRVEDSGSAVKNQHLDIAVATHAGALSWYGFGAHDVWVLAPAAAGE
ncbi:MAG: hypothetical protein GXY32_01855 [Ruminococcaceae bacterium]|nr:hypothetical protein [Oscillospiraceae bacterium]